MANLGLHTTVPVDLFSGLPQIQIPLVALEDRDFSIPVSLSYHSDGVKPDSHPGWTGLGWSLMNAGGSITRIRKGVMDEADLQGISDDISYYGNCEYLDADDWDDVESLNYALFGGGRLYKDFEPDEFLFSVPGFSGKFFLNHNKEWVFTSNSGEKFEMVENPQLVSNFQVNGADFYDNSQSFIHANFLDAFGRQIFNQFKLRGNDGVIYTFGGTDASIEYTRDYTAPGMTPADGYELIPTAWHLTEMESPNGNIITFNYKRDGVAFRESASTNFFEYEITDTDGFWPFNWQYTALNTYTGNARSVGYSLLYPSYLEEIVGSNGKIVFETEHTNQLLYGVENGVDIIDFHITEEDYSIYPKLTRVYLERSGEVVRDMRLTYTDQPNSRLILNSVYEQAGTETLPPYVFDYNNSGSLPEYNSLEVDHWGYFNGENYFDGLPNTHRFSWADVQPYFDSRSPDADLMKIGILTQIDYPTGGSSVFEYEPNSYSRQANRYPFEVVDVDEAMAGGLRIKKIHSLNVSGEELMAKEYFYEDNYTNVNTRSSGILSGVPDYLEIDTFQIHGDKIVQYWHITNNNINPLNETNGRHVTYTNVVEKFSDGGYRELKYSNHDNAIPEYLDEPALSTLSTYYLRLHQDPHTSRQRERGKLLNEWIYRSDKTLL